MHIVHKRNIHFSYRQGRNNFKYVNFMLIFLIIKECFYLKLNNILTYLIRISQKLCSWRFNNFLTFMGI